MIKGGADLNFLALSQTPAYTIRAQVTVYASRDVPI